MTSYTLPLNYLLLVSFPGHSRFQHAATSKKKIRVISTVWDQASLGPGPLLCVLKVPIKCYIRIYERQESAHTGWEWSAQPPLSLLLPPLKANLPPLAERKMLKCYKIQPPLCSSWAELWRGGLDRGTGRLGPTMSKYDEFGHVL